MAVRCGNFTLSRFGTLLPPLSGMIYLYLLILTTALYAKHSRGNLRRAAGVLQSATGSARGQTDGKAGNGSFQAAFPAHKLSQLPMKLAWAMYMYHTS